MPDPIRAKDSLSRPVPPATGRPALPAEAAPASRFADDAFFRSAPTPEQVAGLHRAIAALDALPAAPKGVLEQRIWLEQIAPARKAAALASRGLGNAAFFHKAIPQGAADAAAAKVRAFEARARDAEERSGLRKPTPPLDPNRPGGQATRLSGQLLEHPVGAVLGAALTPIALIFDGVDAVSRPSERAAYPAAFKAYQARLAAYERARRDFPPAP
ncbi:MAG: hypothetical protein VKQ33_09395 [Candidatus Sericytochromatia bacterium]|nr:hypothetical protein [Candidatus Sericytochromatia bacterium]